MRFIRYTQKILLAALMGILWSCMVGCKKDDPETSYSIEPNGLAYIQIPIGRYFIYKDSATLKTDSVVVTESVLANLHTPDRSALGQFSYQKYTLKLTKMDTVSSAWLGGEATAMFYNDQFSMISTTANFNYDGYMFRYPVSLGNGPANGLGDSLMANMSVEGKTYNNVVRTAQTYPYGSIYYWAKGIGIIKYNKGKGGNLYTTYTLLRNG